MAFGAAVAVASSHAFLLLFIRHQIPNLVEQSIVGLAIILPAIGSAIGGIRTHREYSRLEKRSGVMKSNLEELDQLYDKIRTYEQFVQALRLTDKTMLQEAQDWLILMKPVELNPL